MPRYLSLSLPLIALTLALLLMAQGHSRPALASGCPTLPPTSAATQGADAFSASGGAGQSITEAFNAAPGTYKVTVSTQGNVLTVQTQVLDGSCSDNPMLIAIVGADAIGSASNLLRVGNCALVFNVRASAAWKLSVTLLRSGLPADSTS